MNHQCILFIIYRNTLLLLNVIGKIMFYNLSRLMMESYMGVPRCWRQWRRPSTLSSSHFTTTCQWRPTAVALLGKTLFMWKCFDMLPLITKSIFEHQFKLYLVGICNLVFFPLFIKGNFYVPTKLGGNRAFDWDMRMPKFHHKNKSCVL